MFASQFGSPAEGLEEDPGAATRQYSARDAKGTKLAVMRWVIQNVFAIV